MSSVPQFPKSFGLLLYPQFEVLDVAGPIEALNCLARADGFENMKLSIVSRSLDPVSIGPSDPRSKGSDFMGVQLYQPTHTFETAPQLDVLIVPGGAGSMGPPPKYEGYNPDVDDYIDFVKTAYHGFGERKPLKYLISVCNGTILLAKAGVLDGQKATTNKDFWTSVTQLGPKTYWTARARWVASGNIWTTSGVSAGTDGVLAWMSSLLPEKLVTGIVNTMEWIRAENADNDPFAEVFGCEDVPPRE